MLKFFFEVYFVYFHKISLMKLELEKLVLSSEKKGKLLNLFINKNIGVLLDRETAKKILWQVMN